MRLPIAGLVFGCILFPTLDSEAQSSCPEETIYVAMLGTRKHRLSGKNPTVGVFYTHDFGKSWHHTGWEQGKAFAVFVEPQGSCGDTLWIAAGNGVMRSVDGGGSWRITTGWEVTEVQDVWVPPGEPAEVWAATPYGTYFSSDSGGSWQNLGGGFASSVRGVIGTERGLMRDGEIGSITDPVRSIRQSPHDPDVWLVALQNHGVRVSADAGASFHPSGLDGVTIYEAEFHPANDSVIYAGGWNTGLLVSHDLGQTWHRLEGLAAANIHGIAVSRLNPDFILVGSMDDGVFASDDAGLTWRAVAPEIFESGQIWDVHIRGE